MTINSAARVSGKPDVNMFLYRDRNELGMVDEVGPGCVPPTSREHAPRP
jgi:hypothetical protein